MNNWGRVDEAFLNLVQLLVNTVMHNCLFLVPAFMIIGMLVAMIRAVFTPGEMAMDPGFLLRGVIIWFILFNYLEILDLVTGAIEGFAKLIPPPDGILNDLNAFATSTVTLKKDLPDPNASPVDRMLDYIQGAFNFQFGLHYWLLSAIEQGITLLIRVSFEKLRAMLLAFLTVVGPLSLTLSVFPGMEKVASHWFRGWFVVHMWSVTFRVLDSIIHSYNEAVFDRVGEHPDMMIDSLVINVVCALMYLMVPSLTTYFVGYAATSGFFSKLAGVVSTVASVAAFGGRPAGMMSSSSTAPVPYGAGASVGGPSYPGGGGSPTPLPPGPSAPLALPPGGGYLLGGGSPVGIPSGPGSLPPLSGSSAAPIPVRHLPVSPRPRPIPVRGPEYSPYELI